MEIRRFLTLVAALLLGFGMHAQSFTEKEVSLTIVKEPARDTIQLAGTLTMPTKVRKKVPAVILITGSGAQNRDEEIMGHKPFKVIAEYLSARGYAVLRCDDRGVGESTGDIAHATTLDFAHDIDHLLMYLQSPRSGLDIDPNRIYLFGHSEGTTVAAIVAAKNRYTLNPVAGVAMLGGAAVDGKTLLLQQNEAIFRLQGLEDSLIVRRLACMRELFAVCDTLHLSKDADTVKTINMAFRPLFKKYSAGLSKEQKKKCGLTTGDCYGWALTVATPWMRTFLSLDPAEYIAQMHCPLLAIGGEKDCQVQTDANLSVIENICEANGIPCRTIRLPDINHLGQVCHTGAVDEYATLGQAPAESVLSALTQWLDSISSQSERTKN